MSIVRSIVAACLFSSAAVYAVDVDLTAPAFLDDFNDGYGDAPHQNCLGAINGIVGSHGSWELGGGYWYVFQDDKGSLIKNSAGDQIVERTNEESMIPDSTLSVKLITSTVDSTEYPYAGVGCVLAGPNDGLYFDLTKMTAISMRVKGTGTVRMHLETKDIADSTGKDGWGWGFYGSIITLTSEWKDLNIPIASLIPEKYSRPDSKKWTWAQGKVTVNKIAFQVKNGKDAELHVDDIKIVGMTYGDFKFPASRVISSKVAKGPNMFNVNASSISFKLAQAQDLTVSLNDVMGNQIRSLYTGKTASETINLNDKNLASGRYLVVVSGKNVNYSQSIVVMK